MLELGLVESIDDVNVFNYFRLNGQLNVHAEYGYLANQATGQIIADWWRGRGSHSGPLGKAAPTTFPRWVL